MRLVRHDGPSGHLYRIEDGEPLGDFCHAHHGGTFPNQWVPSVSAILDRLSWPGLEVHRRQRLAYHVACAAKQASEQGKSIQPGPSWPVQRAQRTSIAAVMQDGMQAERTEATERMDRGTRRHADIAKAIQTGEVGVFDTAGERALAAVRRLIPSGWTLHVEAPIIACNANAEEPRAEVNTAWGGTVDLLATSPVGDQAVVIDWKTSDLDHARDLMSQRDQLQVTGYAAGCLYQAADGVVRPMPTVIEARVIRFGQISTAKKVYDPRHIVGTWRRLAALAAALSQEGSDG